MFQRETAITNPTGLHARPASQLTQFCKGFHADIKIIAGTNEVDPKSIISILAAGMRAGTTVTVRVEGEDEENVGNQLVEFIENLRE